MLISYFYYRPSSSRQDYTKVYRYNVFVCEREFVHVRVYVCVCVCVCERECKRAGEHVLCVCVCMCVCGEHCWLGHQSTTPVVVRSEPHQYRCLSIIPPPSCKMGT